MNERKQYRNGDRCPCCGQVIEGKSAEWLELFSLSVALFLDGGEPIYPIDVEGEKGGPSTSKEEIST